MPLTTPTILLGFFLPWAWGISSRLLQQSTAAAPYLDEGYLLTAAVPDLQCGIAPLGPPVPVQPKKQSKGEKGRRKGKAKEKRKSKGGKERYKHLNAEFQRITRRDKKALLSDQCKEIEENNRMGKTKDLFKKIKRYQGNISCKDGLDKGQKCYGPNRSRRY